MLDQLSFKAFTTTHEMRLDGCKGLGNPLKFLLKKPYETFRILSWNSTQKQIDLHRVNKL